MSFRSMLDSKFTYSDGKGYALVFLTAIAMVVFSGHARASSCCAASGGQTICVLPDEQNYQVGVATSVEEMLGHTDGVGRFHRQDDTVVVRRYAWIIGAAYRVTEDVQLSVSLPTLFNKQRFSKDEHTATGLGDTTFEGRYSLWQDLAFLRYRPSVSFYSGARLPTGTSVYDAQDRFSTDVTGDGFVSPYLGVSVAKLYQPWRFSVDASVIVPLGLHVTSMHQKPLITPYDYREGLRFQFAQGASYLINSKWSASLTTLFTLRFLTKVDAQAVLHSGGRRLSLDGAIHYFHSAALQVNVGLSSSLPMTNLDRNQAQLAALRLSVAYGVGV